MSVKFVWDEKKAVENEEKHKVSFSKASTIFTNIPLEIFFDPDHSAEEDRYVAIGISEKERILLVVRCENEKGSEIRIISARKATNKERISVFGKRI